MQDIHPLIQLLVQQIYLTVVVVRTLLVLLLLFVHQVEPVLALGSMRPMFQVVLHLHQLMLVVLVLELLVVFLIQIGMHLNLVLLVQHQICLRCLVV